MSGLELDLAVLERRLHHLALAVDRLADYQDLPLDRFESDEGIDWTVLHGLQLCIQAVLDISAHLVAASGTAVPDQYSSSVALLGRLGILPQEFAERIAPMAGFRNILVHQYLDVDMGLVKQVLDEQLDDFRTFGRHIECYLKQSD